MSDKKTKIYHWTFIDYFVTVAIAIMPFFAFLLLFLKRPKDHKIHMLVAGLVGFASLYILIKVF